MPFFQIILRSPSPTELKRLFYTTVSLLDSEEGEGGMILENGIETCMVSYVKRIASPGSMHDTGCLRLMNR